MGYPVKFGKYLLLERVNVGGMAEVFKAKTFGVAGFERILAIKRILPTLVEDDEFVRMFIDEARIAVQLNHANIAQIYELGKHGEHFYIAMEYLSSKDLRAILDKMRLNNQLMPIPQAAYIISKVCEGLDYAHRRLDPSGSPMNIIHRDVSPQNVLISYEGEVKIIDFGIAKAANRASKTQAGVLKGKFGYMSPEQVRGLPIDRRSDVFAVGVLLYEMLTGERLFIGESDFSTLERVRNAEVAPPTTFNKKITPELEEIVLKALAREVEDRFQWASELSEALQVFLFEERSLYNAKRLAAYMKETYNTDIASERDKMEQYLQLDQSDPAARPPTPPASSTEGNEATALRPRTSEADGTDDYVGEADYLEDYEGEERTIVIEASEAGIDLQAGAHPHDDGPKIPEVNASDPAGQAPQLPKPTGDVTNDDYLIEPSLYGGDDDDYDDDDAKTQVSFENPFDENPQRDPPSMPPPPSAQDALLIHEESSMSYTGDDEIVPGLGTAGAPLDPVTAAMQEELSGQMMTANVRESPQVAGVSSTPPPFVAPSPPPALPVDTAFDPAAADQPMPEGADQTPTPDVDGGPPNLPRPKKKGMGAGLIIGLLLGGLFAVGMVATTAYVAYDRLIATPGPVASSATLQLIPAGDVPATVTVTYNGDEVATKLPADVKLGDPPHRIKVTAPGRQEFAIDLPASIPQLFVTLPPQQGAESASGKPAEDAVAAKTAKTDKTPPVAVVEKSPDTPEDVKTAPEPSDEKPSEDADAKDAPGDAPAAVAKTDDAEAGDSSGRPSNLLDAHWRISFATIGSATRAPIQGAEVFFEGAIIGRTPFEGEFPTTAEQVELEVRAPGFMAKKISVARDGRDVVGPATVQLSPPEDGAEAKAETEGNASDGEGNGDEKVASASEAEGKTNPEGENANSGEDAADDDTAAADTAKDDTETAEAPRDDDDDDDTKVASAKSAKAPKEADDETDDSPKASSSKSSSSKSSSTKSTSSKSKSGRTTKKSSKSSKSDDGDTPSEPKPSATLSRLAVGTIPSAEVFVNKKKIKHWTPLIDSRALRLKQGTNYMLFKTQDGKTYPYKIEIGADSPSNKLKLQLGKSISTTGNVKATYLK